MMEILKLGDFASFKYGKMPDKKKISDSGRYPVYSGYRYVGYYDEYNTEANQLIIVARGVGGTGDVKITKEKCYLTNLSIVADIDETIALPEYLYYYYLPRNLRYLDSGSAQSQITISDLERVEIPLPSVEEQRTICSYLKMLDNKISVNNEINQNLQEQANIVFNEWFGCHLRESSVPLGWSESALGDLDVLITDYVANGSFKSLADNVQYLEEKTNNVLIRLTDYNNNYSSDMVYISDDAYEFLAKSKLFGDEIIISNVGANVGTVFRCPRLDLRMSLGPNAVLLRSSIYEHYLYHLFISDFGKYLLNSIVTGSAQPKFNKTNFRSLRIFVPDRDSIEKFNKLYAPIYERIALNAKENSRLTEIRDTLLPRLMSGDIDVSSINI